MGLARAPTYIGHFRLLERLSEILPDEIWPVRDRVKVSLAIIKQKSRKVKVRVAS